MSQQTLKELLKPPFYHEGGYIHDTTKIAVAAVGYDQEIICDFIVTAMNERWERELGEPKWWIIDNEYGYGPIRCPDCGSEHKCHCEGVKENWKYCPRCGTKLDPPEEN